MNKPHKAAIYGFGYHVPAKILTNAQLETMVNTNDEWIVTRTGIRERRICSPDEFCSDLALKASVKALAEAGIDPSELTHIILATMSPDYYIPNTACVLQAKLGITDTVSMDLAAACSGYLHALEVARGIVAIHHDAVVLVAGSEVVSSRTNYEDRSTCILFGDGAGVTIVRSSGRENELATVEDLLLSSNGSVSELLTLKGGGSGMAYRKGDTVRDDFFVVMQGREVFKHAVRCMETISLKLLERNGLSLEEIDLFIPHQANMRIIEALAKKMNYAPEKVYVNLERYGNTSAASIPLALAEAWDKGLIKPGARVLLASFGGGLTWGAALLKF